ncbi:site-specific integrase [Microlunatus ginsengisoli]|uniref:Site-specific integrase n=2 Tax=Microlunatus ginsengisoli TaxID=363863 RepID=A0ABP7ANS6_9ACTN
MSRRHNGEGSIYPYRNGFAAYAWITTPAGRRQRKYVYGMTREIVHGKWVELTRQATKGPVLTKVPTLSQFLERWLEDTVAPNLAPLTHATYESHVRHYIEPALGNLRLDRLRVTNVQAWLNGLPKVCQCCAQGKDARRSAERRRCCAIGKCCHSTISARTIKDVRAVLRSALASAKREELVERNVAELVTTPKQRSRKVVPWTSEEARHFLESARSDRDRLYAAYVLVLVLGMRKGEVLGLRWDAIDTDAGELIIDRQLQRVRRELLYRVTKTEASDDSLPLPDIVTAALIHRRAEQETARAAAGEAWQEFVDDGQVALVFTGRYGTPIDPRTLNRAFTARCAAAGVRRMTVHDARRTCATLLVDLDVHPRVIMRILRHVDQSVTMNIYAKASSDKTRDALRRLGESLG